MKNLKKVYTFMVKMDMVSFKLYPPEHRYLIKGYKDVAKKGKFGNINELAQSIENLFNASQKIIPSWTFRNVANGTRSLLVDIEFDQIDELLRIWYSIRLGEGSDAKYDSDRAFFNKRGY